MQYFRNNLDPVPDYDSEKFILENRIFKKLVELKFKSKDQDLDPDPGTEI